RFGLSHKARVLKLDASFRWHDSILSSQRMIAVVWVVVSLQRKLESSQETCLVSPNPSASDYRAKREFSVWMPASAGMTASFPVRE
ncbi:MAG: hypothetical protein NT028_10600, partial [candidate division Zixibacteria bacterium]|nr:hypothetical protein [candidate division Zixibacteria bacterium]